jgi:hypothetical protein
MDPVEFRGHMLDVTRDERAKKWLQGELTQDLRTPNNTPGYEYPT